MKTTATFLLCGAVVGLTMGACSWKKSHDDGFDPNFNFATTAPSAYTRVDFVGMPAIATAVIADKDAYNDLNPGPNIANNVADITSHLTNIHAHADADVTALHLTKATTTESLNQLTDPTLGNLGTGDSLKINTAVTSGFPNGRKLTDPVLDVTLALVLLKMGAMTTGPAPAVQTPTSLVGAGLNPAANDKPFSNSFPYLAAPF